MILGLGETGGKQGRTNDRKYPSPKRRVRCVARKLDPEVPRKKKLKARERGRVAAYHGATSALYWGLSVENEHVLVCAKLGVDEKIIVKVMML